MLNFQLAWSCASKYSSLSFWVQRLCLSSISQPSCASSDCSVLPPPLLQCSLRSGGKRRGELVQTLRSVRVFVFIANLRCALDKQNSCVYWSQFLYLLFICLYVSTWVHANMYVKECTCVCQTKMLNALPYGSPSISLNQVLSLNLGIILPRLGWKPASTSPPSCLPTLGLPVQGYVRRLACIMGAGIQTHVEQ